MFYTRLTSVGCSRLLRRLARSRVSSLEGSVGGTRWHPRDRGRASLGVTRQTVHHWRRRCVGSVLTDLATTPRGSSPRRRQIADETTHDGSSPPSTARHRLRSETWTVQHDCVWITTRVHGGVTTAKPPSPVRLPPPPPITSLHLAICGRAPAHGTSEAAELADMLPTRPPVMDAHRPSCGSSGEEALPIPTKDPAPGGTVPRSRPLEAVPEMKGG